MSNPRTDPDSEGSLVQPQQRAIENSHLSPQISPKSSQQMSPTLATHLRSLTPARVGLRRTGLSIAINELLDFQLAHARARDAVHAALQPSTLLTALRDLPRQSKDPLLLHSAAANRQAYLQRPDLGRKLDESSRKRLIEYPEPGPYNLSIVLVDGLSALAVERNATPLLAELLPNLPEFMQLAPICIVEQGRVAIGDEIAHALSASLVIVLIGERPGLSSPDSLGAYITWQPRPGRTDAERNCISNIRSEGLRYQQAAARLLYYIHESHRLQLTGVALKEADLQLETGQ
ncbi:ethanolamine ammonia-lyase subunit EutC [Acidicapsa ligni]|uniref:ethanolamine ammonia-lyase subunit EutC n=1 Tax=Acidicapsa ligni TaxID=542300 RepID=UPI0021E0B1D9|nr:ethanolamine ammonia-lyase subunit EutC [Acidicapsa ligni]